MREVVVAVVLLVACVLALAASIGLLRFRDVYTRAHAATKPQNMGMLLALIGVIVSVWHQVGMVVLIFGFQLATAPVAANMVARAAYRSGVRSAHMHTDEFADD